MTIAQASTGPSCQQTTPTVEARRALGLRRTRFVSLLALSGALLAPMVAQAQPADAPPAGATADAAAPESAPAPEAAPPAEGDATAPDAATAEGEEDEEAPALEANPVAPSPRADFGREGTVVTGYRASLKEALKKKRKSTGQVDAIVAEDMADFPDQNLAESLQRIPGVAIERSEGEGSRITVRGLGSRFTRTRVNGMDARAAVKGNAGRSFDFNMFASELFNSIVVHKTATAELGEGALGAVIDLNTARAFDYKKGVTVLVGAQGGYNDLSSSFFPRATGLVTYHAPSGIWGATASIAYSKSRIDSAVVDTARWEKARFRSVNGVACPAMNATDPGCVAVADAFHPRIPGYGYSENEGDRIGVTAGVQVRPIDDLEIKLDGFYARYDTTQNFHTIEAPLRSQQGQIDITAFRIDQNPVRSGRGNNTIVAATANNAVVRSEAVRQLSENDFKQLTLTAALDVTKNFSISALGGVSRTGSKVPHETSMIYDDVGYNGFSYDFSNQKLPSIVFGGPDVTDPANFALTQVRDLVRDVEVSYDVANLDFDWEALGDQLKVSVGGAYKGESMSLNTKSRGIAGCPLAPAGGGPPLAPGLTFDCDSNDDGMNDVLGPQGRPDNSFTFEYPSDVGGNSNKRWASPNIDRWIGELGLYNKPAADDRPDIREVEERSYAAYLQAGGEVPLGSTRLAYDAGVRYVQTLQVSRGYADSTWVEVKRDPYSDVLPSANAALWVTEDFVTRLAASRVMSRPELSDLSAGASIDGFNFQASRNDPNLNPNRAWALDVGAEWYFAPEAVVSVAGFLKKVDSLNLETHLTTGRWADVGYDASVLRDASPARLDPDARPWNILRRVNGGGATVLGAEFGFAAPFNSLSKSLPVALRDMGFTGNYTYIYSRFPWNFQGNTLQERLQGLSTHSANATLYYDDSRFNIRGSLAWRSQYISAGDANQNGNLFQFDEPPPRLDMSAGFKLTKSLQFTAEAINVTNAPINTFVDIDARRRLTYGTNGRTFFLGARYSFNVGGGEDTEPAKPAK